MLSSSHDLKVGLRSLAKERSFSVLAIFVLAIGISAVTTQLSVVNSVLYHAFEFPQADRLVDVRMVDPNNFTPTNFNSIMSTKDFVEVQEIATSFDELAAYISGSTVNIRYKGQPKRLTGAYVTHNYFKTLGVSPEIGDDFRPENDRVGAEKVVLLAHSLWKSDFDSNPNIIGESLRVNGNVATIVGVMPPRFNFPTREQIWIPLNSEFPVRERGDPGINFVDALGRLKGDVSIDQAQLEMTGIAQQFSQNFPDTNEQFTRGFVRPLIDYFTPGNLAGTILSMLAFCIGVLLIACVNVMNMQFARATLRARELAIRASLGASRYQLIRQMLTESFLLAAIGGAIGVSAAVWATTALDTHLHTNTRQIPSWMIIQIDPKTLGLVLGAVFISTIASGLIPAFFASRTDVSDTLKEGGRGNTSKAALVVTRSLVILQILVTCILLIGSLLQTQAIIRQQSLDYGYDTESVLVTRLGLMEGDYPETADRVDFYRKVLKTVEESEHFEYAAITNRFRMVFSGNGPIEIEGREYVQNTDRTNAQFERISPDFFNTLDVKLLEGRFFADFDSDQRDPVAIVTESFARTHFPDESAIGKRFRTTRANGTFAGPWRNIVGIVSEVRMHGPFNAEQEIPGFYVPFFNNAFGPAEDIPVAPQFGTILARPRGGQDPLLFSQQIQELVNKVDPNLPLYFTETPRIALDNFTAQSRVVANLFALFGIIAVILAAVGLYGVMSFSVNQRTPEFGLRMALGAGKPKILRMVINQAAWQLGAGLLLGIGAALAISQLGGQGLANAFFGISPRDPLTYTIVSVFLILTGLASTYAPAIRATKSDPMVALRTE
ncbi:ABC transporter permease [Pelagicoccus mobilis]|uniref:ABC transporter permease n=1 Tax=Pelagicoccus mobilis TaxID=415221 RepID=A0A934VN90_9BACT|nr:ABC transporter permease [Pelagicoccus mobilis]MBK1879681.1 ABC transporter permease [Pelagicoccus mobilis]